MTMAYKCRKCGYIVRDKRKNCPKCGQNIKKDKFKRICKHFVLLIGILILCLSGLSFFQQKRTEQVINEFLKMLMEKNVGSFCIAIFLRNRFLFRKRKSFWQRR